MTELTQLRAFFAENSRIELDEFEAAYDGAFFLFRMRNMPPACVFLPRQEGFSMTVGSDEDADLPFEMDQTLDPIHMTVSYHQGFRGWVVVDHETSFGTHVADMRLQPGKAQLLIDREVVKAGGLLEMQFYLNKTLFTRMKSAGITRRRKIVRPGDGDGDDDAKD